MKHNLKTGGLIGAKFYNFKWKYFESKKLERFRDFHKGEDCFIIGNGPSLKRMDLYQLNKYHTFGLNKIFLLFEKIKLDLSYYVAVNPYVIGQSVENITSIQCPVFLPFTYSPLFSKCSNIYSINDKNRSWEFHTDITHGVSQGFTVTFVAMQLAYFMGFNRIFLIGVDHFYHQLGRPNEVQVMEGDDLNHFDSRYFQGQNWNLADLANSKTSYLMAKKAFYYNNMEIYDATVNGKLDVFEKITFEESLARAKVK